MNDKVVGFPPQHTAENAMITDLNDLITKYNGQMSNVAMLGILTAVTDYVSLTTFTKNLEEE